MRVILLLTGSIKGTKDKVEEFKESFNHFRQYWEPSADSILENFKKVNKGELQGFITFLKELEDNQTKVNDIPNIKNIGAISIKVQNIKSTLYDIIENIKKKVVGDLHSIAKDSLETLYDEIKQTQNKLNREVNSIESLVSVMNEISSIRKEE